MSLTLNREQRAAVDDQSRIVLTTACPGAGKTRTLAAAVGQSVSGQWALCLTFTRRAAGELRERLGKLGPGQTYIGTLHGWCYNVLREHHQQVGYRDERILVLDKELQRRYVDQVVAGMVGAPGAGAVLKALNRYGSGEDERDPKLARAIELYRLALRSDNAVDYGLLIREVLGLFRSDPSVALRHANQYRRVLVDEVQDLDPAQWALLTELMLARKELRLFAVGDVDQMIYAWRGASEAPLAALKAAGASCRELNWNYRSGRRIVRVVQALIACNTWRTQPMTAMRDLDGELGRIPSLSQLGPWTRNRQEGWAAAGKTVAFLSRTQEGVLELTEWLTRAGVEVERVGARQSRDDTWALMAYLLWYELPHWRGAADAVMAMEDMGEIDRRTVWAAAERDGLLALEVACARHPSLGEFYQDWKDLNLSERIVAVGVRAKARIGRMPEAYSRIVQEFGDYAGRTKFVERSAYGLWAELADQEPVRSSAPLQAMTMHAAKGLEFDIVVIGRMGSMFRPTLGNTQDERRLLYVAASRAREELWVLETGERNPLVEELKGHMEYKPCR